MKNNFCNLLFSFHYCLFPLFARNSHEFTETLKHTLILFCVQVLRGAIDQMGGISQEPTARRITVEAETDATKKLKYNVPIIGTQEDHCSFLIKCYLPDSTSKQLQKGYINNNIQYV